MPRDLIIAQFRDRDTLTRTIDRAIAWDTATPYSYDYRWINLHGLKAIQSGLSDSPATEAMTAPKDEWPALSQSVHTQTRLGLLQAFDQLKGSAPAPAQH